MARRRNVRPGGEPDRRRPDRPALFQFFKVILTLTLEQNKLRIPGKFVREYGEELGDSVDLVVPNGSVWKVGLSKERNKIWFDDGWKTFVDHFSIGHGHFLVFAYTGLCSFNVLIFDKTAAEIEYPCNNQIPGSEENCEIRNEAEIQEDTPSEVLNTKISSPSTSSFNKKQPEARTENSDKEKPEQKIQTKRSEGSRRFEKVYTRNKRPKVEKSVEVIDVDDNDKRRKNLATEKQRSDTKSLSKCGDRETEIITVQRYKTTATPKSERAMAAAMKYTPERPSFMILLREYNFPNKRVYVPSGFYQYLKEAPEYMKLKVSDGRQWEVEFCRQGTKRVDIGSGWSEFARTNNLALGNVCVFELTETVGVLKVSVFREIENVKQEYRV